MLRPSVPGYTVSKFTQRLTPQEVNELWWVKTLNRLPF